MQRVQLSGFGGQFAHSHVLGQDRIGKGVSEREAQA